MFQAQLAKSIVDSKLKNLLGADGLTGLLYSGEGLLVAHVDHLSAGHQICYAGVNQIWQACFSPWQSGNLPSLCIEVLDRPLPVVEKRLHDFFVPELSSSKWMVV